MDRHGASNLREREESILNATLELVGKEGLLKTSISKISAQARCSPGIVYHYFASKDEIMQRLFQRICIDMMAYILQEEILELPLEERYPGLWLRKYHFHRQNHKQTVFLEQFKNSSYFDQEQQKNMMEIMAGLSDMGREALEAGQLMNLSLDDIYVLTFAVALNLAKAHSHAGVYLEDSTLEMLAERVCRSVMI